MMTLATSRFFFLPTAALLLLAVTARAHAPHKICVPERALDACHNMIEQAKEIGIQMECYPARDRLDCLGKVKDHKADFEAVDPEDMYIAGKMDDPQFRVFKEIRTRQEPEAEFRYEAVAVIHKDLDIDNLHKLKGLRSCHTGVGRNVGYKIPITKLSKMGILEGLNDSTLSPRENELKALSNFFSKACLVGKWSPHPETNQKLKAQYNNLCDLCEHPDICDYPDANSGYGGALNCLANAGGQIAWTKVIYVKKFFGMPYGAEPAKPSEHNAADFAYLCPDASKQPITGTPCTWAARPWPGYMATNQISSDFEELRKEITKLNDLGESKHANWLTEVLLLNNATIAKDNPEPVQPIKYLEKAKYLDVIERGQGRKVILCVDGENAGNKCHDLMSAAYSRDIRPVLECRVEASSKACVEAVKEGKAHITVLDPHVALTAQQSYNLKPLVMEKYESSDSQQLVLLVKKSSPYQKMEDIKGTKACLLPYATAGHTGTLKFLLESGLISKANCPHENSLKDFFSQVTVSDDPVDCLVKGGDVAFVPYSSLHSSRGADLEVLCSAGRKPFEDAKTCFLTTLPPKLLMSSDSLGKVEEDDVLFSMLAAGDLFAKRPDIFRLFGQYNGHPNLIFSDHATGLIAVADVVPSFEEYKKTFQELTLCKV